MVAQSNHGNVHVYMIYCYQSRTTSIFTFLRQISWYFPAMQCTGCVHMLYWSLIVFQQIHWRCLFLLGDSWASHKDTEIKGVYYNCMQCNDRELCSAETFRSPGIWCHADWHGIIPQGTWILKELHFIMTSVLGWDSNNWRCNCSVLRAF